MGLALLFPGQGSHAVGMDEPWRDAPLLEQGIAQLGFDPFTALAEGTRTQQPALFLCSMAAWDAAGVGGNEVIAAAGHSLGEIAALVAAGAIGFEDALTLVHRRATAMDAAARARPGGMVAFLGGDEAAVRALGERLGLVVANDNAPGQLVLSGALGAVDAAAEAGRGETGARARKLDVAGAFHSPLMEPAAEELRAALADTPIADPAFPVYANGTAQPFADVRAELAENLLRPVRFRESLLNMAAAGVTDWDELGPGKVLSGLVKRTVGRSRTTLPPVGLASPDGERPAGERPA